MWIDGGLSYCLIWTYTSICYITTIPVICSLLHSHTMAGGIQDGSPLTCSPLTVSDFIGRKVILISFWETHFLEKENCITVAKAF